MVAGERSPSMSVLGFFFLLGFCCNESVPIGNCKHIACVVLVSLAGEHERRYISSTVNKSPK